jgi:hypothetical protein
MDPKKRAKGGGRVEIVREAVPRRKIRLSDIMSESFSRYLMELDGDFIAPTGLRMSELDEAEKSTGGQYTPDAVKRAQELQADDPTATPDSFLTQAERELSAPTPPPPQAPTTTTTTTTTPQPPTTTPPPPVVTHPGKPMLPPVDDDDPTAGVVPPPPVTPPPGPPAQPPTGTTPGPDDVDDARGAVDPNEVNDVDGLNLPGPDDESGPDTDARPPDEEEDDSVNGTGNVEDPSPPTDSADGGPDEFDEKNRPFTNFIDSLISGTPLPGPGTDTLSEGPRRRLPSLAEAVFGSSRLEIVSGR